MLKLIPSRVPYSVKEWDLLSLSFHHGGLGVVNPTSVADLQYSAFTYSLKELTIEQAIEVPIPNVCGTYQSQCSFSQAFGC